MADSATSAFPKMGEEPLTHNLVNASGNRGNTIPVARPAQGDAIATGGTAVRGVGPDASGERDGARLVISTILYPNSSEMSQTGRGMRVVPSKAGVSDFWNDRASQSGQVIA